MNPLDELNALTALFPEPEPLIACAEHVPAPALPRVYREMLAHEYHMTVTMEDYYKCPVDVKILKRRLEGDIYSREILLLKHGTDQVVQFGIVRLDLRYVTQQVRDEILSGDTPLGRVLINHDVLRHIHLGALLRITVGKPLARYLGIETGDVTYGRLATIFCNQLPAVDLLEIPAPLEPKATMPE